MARSSSLGLPVIARSLGAALVVCAALYGCGGSSSETPWPVEPHEKAKGPAGETRVDPGKLVVAPPPDPDDTEDAPRTQPPPAPAPPSPTSAPSPAPDPTMGVTSPY